MHVLAEIIESSHFGSFLSLYQVSAEFQFVWEQLNWNGMSNSLTPDFNLVKYSYPLNSFKHFFFIQIHFQIHFDQKKSGFHSTILLSLHRCRHVNIQHYQWIVMWFWQVCSSMCYFWQSSDCFEVFRSLEDKTKMSVNVAKI